MPPRLRCPDPTPARRLAVLRRIVADFAIEALEPVVRAADELAGDDAPVNVAVIGQFKAGKSSMLNALLGESLLPTGAVPVTAIVTRLAGGPMLNVTAHAIDGTMTETDPARLAELVTEEGNPGNRRALATVDVTTPAIADLHGLRLIDTPGLGSSLDHNTTATLEWLPNIAFALVAVGADRPLSADDLRLIADARRHAPNLAVVLTKSDLLDDSELSTVRAHVESRLQDAGAGEVAVIPFSMKSAVADHVGALRRTILQPLVERVGEARRAALEHKVALLDEACRSCLEVGLRAAEARETQRAALAELVRTEANDQALALDEIALAAGRVNAGARGAFETWLGRHRADLTVQLDAELRRAMAGWRGTLSAQVQSFDRWLRAALTESLTPLSETAKKVADERIADAALRSGRIVAAARARAATEVERLVGVRLPEIAWQPHQSGAVAPPVSIGRVFSTDWTKLSSVTPMSLIGGLFRGHCRRRLPWEVEKNIERLVSDWTDATAAAVDDLQRQAEALLRSDHATLTRLLVGDDGAGRFREALEELDACAPPN